MGEGNQLFSDSFKSVDVSEDDDIPVPANATCKLRAGCRQVATYKSSVGIACAQHATSDMKPFNPANKKRKHINNIDQPSCVAQCRNMVIAVGVCVVSRHNNIVYSDHYDMRVGHKDRFRN